MQTKFKLLFIVTLLLLGLGLAIIINVSLNFREYSIQNATAKATTVAAIVQDGLTAHMVNGIMDKRKYFLDQIASNHAEIKSLWIVRSENVIKQFGKGFVNERIRDKVDRETLTTKKTVQTIHENTDNITLRISIPYKATVTGTPNCLSCHNVQPGDVLGAVSMEFDITNMRSTSMLTILKILGINLLFIVIVLFIINYFVTPYMQLFSNMKEGIQKAYRGDFSHKFTTQISGDVKSIVNQLNTLFRKMQETFGDIKYNLATFIPQGCISAADPLYEAKVIIKELSDIYKFKKTIELDLSKEIVYNRIVDILKEKYHLKSFMLFEINTHNNKRELIANYNSQNYCDTAVQSDALLCRAYRTATDVISSEFINLCQACQAKELEYICIPFTINEEFSLVITISTDDQAELSRINASLPSIKNYLEAAKPVIESRVLTEKLRESSLRDGMTGLYNRRFLEEFIDKFMKQLKRLNEKYAVLMLDVDFFKSVNDEYGHDIGDSVLIAVAKILQENIRESDLAIRYGGEEFVVLLHSADKQGAIQVAQKIRAAFSEHLFEVGGGETIQKTISIGISLFPTDGDTIWKCIKFADTALYIAKTTGRNKVVVFEKTMLEDKELR